MEEQDEKRGSRRSPEPIVDVSVVSSTDVHSGGWRGFYRRVVPHSIRFPIRSGLNWFHHIGSYSSRLGASIRVASPEPLITSPEPLIALPEPLIALPEPLTQDACIANDLRGTGFFDESFYASSEEARASGMDPALHYIRFGEAKGIAPSKRFDPVYYKDSNPDVAAAGFSLLQHYLQHGKNEGRRPLPSTLTVVKAHFTPGLRCVVVVAHEASRTGAPVLAWNIVRSLSRRYNVVVVLVRGGKLEKSFESVASVVIKPAAGEAFNAYDAARVVKHVVAEHRPIYAIANSVETRCFVPPLSRAGIPVIALVHEFSAYSLPIGSLEEVYAWASHIVFPAKIVADSSRDDYPVLSGRRVSVIAQGPSVLPPEGPRNPSIKTTKDQREGAEEKQPFEISALREGLNGGLVVLGVGAVQLRKGVDLFISAAAHIRRIAPSIEVRFVWVGAGFRPRLDVQYSSFLLEQINRSDLKDNIIFIDEVSDLEPIYAQADLMFLSSRLDPLPNVAIDAMLRGIPVICFDRASGLAEFLASDPATADLVVPYLDVASAACAIVRFAEIRANLKTAGEAVRAKAITSFDMERYVSALDDLATKANADFRNLARDREAIAESKGFNYELYSGGSVPHAQKSTILMEYLVQSRLLHPRCATFNGFVMRRPLEGFNQLAYSCESPDYIGKIEEDPLAHFLRTGRPPGRWSHSIIIPDEQGPRSLEGAPRIAIHGHFHYPELSANFFSRLAANELRCDIFLTTSSDDKAKVLQKSVGSYTRGKVTVDVVPNRGRNIGPFITCLRREWMRYDFVGHIHGKRSKDIADAAVGERWRDFMWEHMIGSRFPMADIIVERMISEPSLGLVFPEDPFLVGWDENVEEAKKLLAAMGIRDELPVHFDFPIGATFWARPQALKSLFDLSLSWNDYPEEPIPYDGTMLHAIERILPMVVNHAGFQFATTHVAGSHR